MAEPQPRDKAQRLGVLAEQLILITQGGAGDFFGTRQSGLPDLRIADIVTDMDILVEARQAAEIVLKEDPQLRSPESATLAEYFRAFYESGDLGFMGVG